MADDAHVTPKPLCISCKQAITRTELICPWCGAKQVESKAPGQQIASAVKPKAAQPGAGKAVPPPADRPKPAPADGPKPAAAPKSAAVAPPPGEAFGPQAPVPRVRRPRQEEVVTPGERPSEITFLVILLALSCILTFAGLLIKNDMLMLQPTMFIKDTEKVFTEAAETVAVGGMVFAFLNLAVKSALCYSLWRMLPWARRAAIWTIVALFCIGMLFKAYVTFTMVDVIQQAALAKQEEMQALTQKAYGGGSSSDTETAVTDSSSGTDYAAAPSEVNQGTDTSSTPPSETDMETGNADDSSTSYSEYEPEPEVLSIPIARGTIKSSEDSGGGAPMPTAEFDPDAAFDLAMKNKGPDVKGEYMSGLMMGLSVLGIFAFLYTGFLIYLLRLDHVQQAYGDY